MELILPHDFYSITKNKFLLLDTSVFIDTLLAPAKFGELFTNLRSNGCTLLALDAVQMEFIKGGLDEKSFNKKEQIITDIIDSTLPVPKDVWEEAVRLLKIYKEDGKAASVTDLLLAGTLVKYRKTTFLITKNLTDFPTNIFRFETHFNLLHRKGIHSYGVLSYQKEEEQTF